MDLFTVFPYVVAAVGLFMVVDGVRRFRGDQAFRSTAEHAGARVTDVDWVTTGAVSGGNTTTQAAYFTVRFTLPDGRVVEAQAEHGTSLSTIETGDVVEVAYDPADPTHVQVVEGALGTTPTITSAVRIGGGLVAILVALTIFT